MCSLWKYGFEADCSQSLFCIFPKSEDTIFCLCQIVNDHMKGCFLQYAHVSLFPDCSFRFFGLLQRANTLFIPIRLKFVTSLTSPSYTNSRRKMDGGANQGEEYSPYAGRRGIEKRNACLAISLYSNAFLLTYPLVSFPFMRENALVHFFYSMQRRSLSPHSVRGMNGR